MLDRLPLDVLEHILRLVPESAASVRLVRSMPWTPPLVRLVAEARLTERYRARHRRRRNLCVCSACESPAVDTIVFFHPKAFCTASPYCKDHLPPTLLQAASVYTTGEGSLSLWW